MHTAKTHSASTQLSTGVRNCLTPCDTSDATAQRRSTENRPSPATPQRDGHATIVPAKCWELTEQTCTRNTQTNHRVTTFLSSQPAARTNGRALGQHTAISQGTIKRRIKADTNASDRLVSATSLRGKAQTQIHALSACNSTR